MITAAKPEVDALLARVASGDRPAFGDLYDAAAARVLAVARLVLDDDSAAEAAAGRAWVDVWRQAPRFDPAGGSGLGWILGLAREAAAGPQVAR
ncbi:sigma factor [Actinokineospora guangxiensis]|uniref:Sigma factor n=1 Tax=Actinokineospora guangxiensis TaxID=1490288 RepID=A0ABW0EKH2_9PSEU